MHYDISFPNLGIHLEHVGKTISIFGFEIAYYGIIIGTAILLGICDCGTAEAKSTGQDPENYLDLAMYRCGLRQCDRRQIILCDFFLGYVQRQSTGIF